MRKSNISVHDILFRTAGVLLILTMLSACLLCGMYARYTTSGSYADSSRAARFGTIELKEHQAVESGVKGVKYDLNKAVEVEKNSYSISPGDVIMKDPFVRLTNIGEVRCELYLQVTESDNFPKEIKYDIDDQVWETVADKENVYKYKEPIEPRSENIKISILKDEKLIVGEDYVPDNDFDLTFSAWLKQAKE